MPSAETYESQYLEIRVKRKSLGMISAFDSFIGKKIIPVTCNERARPAAQTNYWHVKK